MKRPSILLAFVMLFAGGCGTFASRQAQPPMAPQALLAKVNPAPRQVASIVKPWMSDAIDPTDWYFGGGGGCTDLHNCFNVMMGQVWGVSVPPDLAPPTVINVLTGTGGGYSNCVNGGTTSGCMTGRAQWSANDCTISTSNFNVTCPATANTLLNVTGFPIIKDTGFALTSTQVGWTYAVVQQNATSTSFLLYPGCWSFGTIASVNANGTTFVANTPTATSGTCGADMGANDTTATVVIWDKQDKNIVNAVAAAETAASSSSAGAIVYLPPGTYAWGETAFQLNITGSHVTIQCQSPTNTTIVSPMFTNSPGGTYPWLIDYPAQDITIKGCATVGTNTKGHSDGNNRGVNDLFQLNGAHVTVEDNFWGFNWGFQNINMAYNGGSPGGGAPCPFGSAADTGNVCRGIETDTRFLNNTFYLCESVGIQINDGQYVDIEGNKFLDCKIGWESALFSNSNSATFLGNYIHNNDMHCDTLGDGEFRDTPNSVIPDDSCSISYVNQTVVVDGSTSTMSGNHLHADSATHPKAQTNCSSNVGGALPISRGNTCTAGENCFNSGC